MRRLVRSTLAAGFLALSSLPVVAQAVPTTRAVLGSSACWHEGTALPVDCPPVRSLPRLIGSDDYKTPGDGILNATYKRISERTIRLGVDTALPCEQLLPENDKLCMTRNEIGEQGRDRSPFNALVWHGVTLSLAQAGKGADATSGERLVILQFKQTGSDAIEAMCKDKDAFQCSLSPTFALRFADDQLFVTSEVKRDPDIAPLPEDGKCPDGRFRARLNDDPHLPFPTMSVLLAAEGAPLPAGYLPKDGRKLGCTAALKSAGPVAMPRLSRERPMRVLLGVKGGSDGSGHVEMIVDGKTLLALDGVVGFPQAGTRGYFKIGPYGDFLPGKRIALDIADFARGPTRASVE